VPVAGGRPDHRLFIIIEDSLAIDDYVDVGGHLGTVEGLTIRTVRLRDIDGIVHTIPFSEIKSIKNYSREFGYAIFRVAVPASMDIDNAIKLMREVGQKMRTDPLHAPQHLVAAGDAGCGKLRVRQRDSARPLQDRADQAMGSVPGVQPVAEAASG
jgi:small-conductance mechanosensitive channel